jgi:hypothetical protein
MKDSDTISGRWRCFGIGRLGLVEEVGEIERICCRLRTGTLMNNSVSKANKSEEERMLTSITFAQMYRPSEPPTSAY